jgi:hypothetical protein
VSPCSHQPPDPIRIGIGVGLAASPSHTTVHTGPYTAVRQIVRTPVPTGGAAAGVWNRASTKKLRSLPRRAVGLHLSGWHAGRKNTGILPHGSVEMHVSTLHFHRSVLRRITPPTMPSADFCAAVRAPYGALSRVAGTQCRPPEVRPTAFPARPPDLPPRPLMVVDFAIHCSLVRPGRPRYPVLVHRAAVLLHASFRPRLATTPLRFANPSPPSGRVKDFHLQAVDHARHTMKKPRVGRGRSEEGRWCWAGASNAWRGS